MTNIDLSFVLYVLILFFNILFLAIATVKALKYREIPDKIWLALLLTTIPLIIVKSIIDHLGILFFIIYGLNIFIGVMFGLIMFYSGAWGGADSKAIMSISITFPYQAFFLKSNCILLPILGISINFLVFFISLIFAFLIYNAVFYFHHGELFSKTEGTLIQKISILVSGYKEELSKLENKRFVDIAEEKKGDDWYLVSSIALASPEDDISEFEEKYKIIQRLIDDGKKHVWVRPQPPGILFIFLAFIFYVLMGSPLLSLIVC